MLGKSAGIAFHKWRGWPQNNLDLLQPDTTFCVAACAILVAGGDAKVWYSFAKMECQKYI